MRIHRSWVVLLALLAGACAGTETRTNATPEELYRDAQSAVKDADYEVAAKLFDRIRDEYPFAKVAVEAELLAADMLFDQEKYEEAAAAYGSFEEMHPTHPRVAYAMYRRGLAEAALSRPEDQDQTATRKAGQAFQKLLYAYPQSEYAEDARVRLGEMRARLAAHELYVAQYYARRKQHRAAIARLQALVRDYPETSQREEALRLAAELQAKEANRGD